MGGDTHNQPVPVGHRHSDPIPAQDSRNGPASGIRVMEKEFRQDGPPKGGYKPIIYKGIFPNRGPGPMTVLGVGLAVMTYGFVQVIRGNRKARAEKSETTGARKDILPFLQSEEDLRYCEQKAKFVSMEAKIMSNVPGWVAGKSVYHSERWIPYFEGSQRAKATPGW